MINPDPNTCTREEMATYLAQFRHPRLPRSERYDDTCFSQPETPPIKIELAWPDTQERAAHWREVNALSQEVRELRVQMRKLREDMDGMMVARRTPARAQEETKPKSNLPSQ